jgi:hypothetical protein
MNRKRRASSTILCFQPRQNAQRIKSYIRKTTYKGTVHTIIENSGTNHFLTGSMRRPPPVSLFSVSTYDTPLPSLVPNHQHSMRRPPPVSLFSVSTYDTPLPSLVPNHHVCLVWYTYYGIYKSPVLNTSLSISRIKENSHTYLKILQQRQQHHHRNAKQQKETFQEA